MSYRVTTGVDWDAKSCVVCLVLLLVFQSLLETTNSEINMELVGKGKAWQSNLCHKVEYRMMGSKLRGNLKKKNVCMHFINIMLGT